MVSHAAFPWWLTGLTGFLGVAALTLFGLNISVPTSPVVDMVFFVYLTVGLIGLHLALAVKFWRTPVATDGTETDTPSTA